jgi:hypothetical protein
MTERDIVPVLPESEMAQYGWIIDIDHLWNPEPTPPGLGYDNETGTSGPWNIPGDIAERLSSGEGRKFQMCGDGELYYSGRIITREEEGSEESGPGSEEDFGPLEDFGKPNAGCEEIHYLDGNGNWVEL